MPNILSGLACPACDALGITSELFQNPGVIGIQCPANATHTWNDISLLRQANARKLPIAAKPDKIQANHVPVTLSVPIHVADALKKKYGDRLSTSLTAVLSACAAERMTILGDSDLQRMEEKLGPNISNAADLFGRIFSLTEEKKVLINENQKLMRKMNVRKGSGLEIELDLQDQLPRAVQMAQDSNKDVNEFLSEYVRQSIENGWVTVS